MGSTTTLLLVSIGNTRARVGVARSPSGEFGAASGVVVEPSVVVENGAGGGLEDAVAEACAGLEIGRTTALVASVNDAATGRALGALDGQGVSAVRLVSQKGGGGGGSTRVVPVATDLDGPVTVGVDRLLCALAAASRSQGQACAVIDAGTCVTVDLVDGHGVFQGGAIAPGLGLMLGAMHQGAPALPAIEPPRSGADVAALGDERVRGAIGRGTRQAMLLGALNAVRGLVRYQVERFAEATGSYPRVIATGGDAPILFDPSVAGGGGDDLVEHIVPDLQLIGMVAAWSVMSDEA